MEEKPAIPLKIKARPDMRKIELSKQQMRRKLAQLPIAEKLRILEQLRDEKLPKQGKRGVQQGEKSGEDPC
jgi:hypothetical protein